MNDEINEVKKKLKYQSKNLSLGKLLFTDFLSMTFSLGPGLFAWAMTGLYIVNYVQSGSALLLFVLSLVGIPLVLIVSFLVAVRFFRLLIPKMKPGIYRMGVTKGFAAWYLTLCLGHSVRIFGLQPFFFTFYITKYLYWKAMGAKIDFGVNSSLFFTVVDYPLITIKKGCSFGAYTHVACHTFMGDKLFLAPVTIGENVYVGMNTTIGPKTKIGNNSWIGLNNRLMQDTIPEGTHIENLEWEYGNPKKREARLNKSSH